MARYHISASSRAGHARQGSTGAAVTEFTVTDGNGDPVTALSQADVGLRLSYADIGDSFVPGFWDVDEKSLTLGGAAGIYRAIFGGTIEAGADWPSSDEVFVELVVAHGGDRGQTVTSFDLPA